MLHQMHSKWDGTFPFLSGHQRRYKRLPLSFPPPSLHFHDPVRRNTHPHTKEKGIIKGSLQGASDPFRSSLRTFILAPISSNQSTPGIIQTKKEGKDTDESESIQLITISTSTLRLSFQSNIFNELRFNFPKSPSSEPSLSTKIKVRNEREDLESFQIPSQLNSKMDKEGTEA